MDSVANNWEAFKTKCNADTSAALEQFHAARASGDSAAELAARQSLGKLGVILHKDPIPAGVNVTPVNTQSTEEI